MNPYDFSCDVTKSGLKIVIEFIGVGKSIANAIVKSRSGTEQTQSGCTVNPRKEE